MAESKPSLPKRVRETQLKSNRTAKKGLHEVAQGGTYKDRPKERPKGAS